MRTMRIVLFWIFSIFFSKVTWAHGDADVPALIPMPHSVKWLDESFNLSECKVILIAAESLRAEAGQLQQALQTAGFTMTTQLSKSEKRGTIFLALARVNAVRNAGEAYRLSITKNSIVLIANTTHGIFNGLQTLLQLTANGKKVKGCKIADYPAFAWRGYMVDAARNYQSPEQLKQQIDVMARYKLNVFHFHLTEDIAWRLQIKKFPQLTAPEFMERNKGKFYSVETMQELISYCKQRHIVLVPEIDIPGHSGAFKRAMGADMQSEKGTALVKEIFEEISSTYDLPYLHIGADEVKITNPAFIPEITALVRKHNKQLIAWAPGGNYDDMIIRQLWKEEGDEEVGKKGVRYIDSKFLYISDYDPLNSVVTIFNRRLGGKPFGDSALLGAEFCLWNDRNVVNETDLISKNPVYPSMLAFSERSWQGNGFPDVVFAIGTDSMQRAKAFLDFETRLLVHKEKYFTHLPFVYVKQTDIQWKLIGPFENKGNLSAAYWPEQKDQQPLDSAAAVIATGGTIWLWHTHGPKVKAWITSPKENTTWYAYAQFWSDSDTSLNVWVDTKDLSRSGADASPPEGEWDYVKSKIWINRTIIPAPNWSFPNRSAGKLNEPMVDENFYYRPPAVIRVNKGWNEVLLKLPMGSFDPLADWQVPPKWMFSFIPVHRGNGINWDANLTRFRTKRKK